VIGGFCHIQIAFRVKGTHERFIEQRLKRRSPVTRVPFGTSSRNRLDPAQRHCHRSLPQNPVSQHSWTSAIRPPAFALLRPLTLTSVLEAHPRAHEQQCLRGHAGVQRAVAGQAGKRAARLDQERAARLGG
jgi:hypothetical protein